MSVHFETLDAQRLDARFLEAARLIITEVEHMGIPNPAPVDEELVSYVRDASSPEYTHYACMDDMTSELVGAARVQHDHPPDTTTVHAFAIRPDSRLQNYGRTFLHYIAEQALVRGNERLELGANTPSFFEHLGFIKPKQYSRYMYALARDVLVR